MTYLPELRDSLVGAAERQAAGAGAEPARRRPRRRPRPFGAFALMAASVLAIVVAGAVLVLVRHAGSVPQAGTRPTPTRAEVVAAAESLLGRFQPPAGAVASEANPAPGSQIGGPADKIADRYSLDLHRFYRVPGTPEQVIDAISRQPPPDLQSQSGEAEGTAGSSTGRRTQSRVVFQAATFNLTRTNGIDRQLTFEAVVLPGGGSALRVDAQAGYGSIPMPHGPEPAVTAPLPPSVASPGHTIAITQLASRKRALRFLNALPSVKQPTAPGCRVVAPANRIVLGATTVLITPGCPQITVETRGAVEYKTWRYAGTLRPNERLKLLPLLTGEATRSSGRARP